MHSLSQWQGANASVAFNFFRSYHWNRMKIMKNVSWCAPRKQTHKSAIVSLRSPQFVARKSILNWFELTELSKYSSSSSFPPLPESSSSLGRPTLANRVSQPDLATEAVHEALRYLNPWEEPQPETSHKAWQGWFGSKPGIKSFATQLLLWLHERKHHWELLRAALFKFLAEVEFSLLIKDAIVPLAAPFEAPNTNPNKGCQRGEMQNMC